MTTRPTWALVVETTQGIGQRKHMVARVLAHVGGSREEALAELERQARSYVPEHPSSPRRRRLLRTGDGFLLVVEGAWQTFATRFTVAEPVVEAAGVPEPVVEAPPPAPPRPTAEQLAELDADGVPVLPSWLGRRDLS